MTMSWKAEVTVVSVKADRWHSSALRFATREEAEAYAENLYSRWTLNTAYRAVESHEEPDYRWLNGKLVEVTAL